MFTAIVNVPGYLPDTAEPTPLFDTACDAWRHLEHEQHFAEAYGADFTPFVASPALKELGRMAEADRAGVVHGDGIVFEVQYVPENEQGA